VIAPRRWAPAVLLSAALLALGTACDPDAVPAPGPSKVDVDTPKLRDMKQAAGVEPCEPGSATRVDGGLPELTLPCFGGGESVDLSGLEGPLVVNLWQGNCAPCIKEMPALQEFYEQYGDRVPVVGIDYLDTYPERAMKLVAKSGVTYPLLADPGGDLNRRDGFPPILGIPVLVFVDEAGAVNVRTGGVDSADELVDLANEHLGTDL
jgi:thiol-disulfide isomerase/thioredoxin